MTEWRFHYTGIEIWNPTNNGDGWYIQRDARTKRTEFVRWSNRIFAVGAFLHRPNYFSSEGDRP